MANGITEMSTMPTAIRSTLFAIAASAYLVALAVILILAPGLRRVESLA